MKTPKTKTPPVLPFTVEEKSRNVHVVNMTVNSTTTWEAWILLRSDAHHDNAHCDWDLEKRHLDLAVERRAGIVDNGDLFCAMQGKWDRRSDTSQCRPEHRNGRYLDSLVETAAEFYAPYAHHFIVMGHGNHETSIIKHHETDLTTRLVERLNATTGSRISAGSFSGWIRFAIQRCNERASFRYFRHHGYGGGGPVTRGAIQTNRMAVYLPDADIVHTGHTHDAWLVPIERVRINQADQLKLDRAYHVRTAGYKEEYGDGFGGWHIERGAPPKPRGAAWLRFFWDGDRGPTFEITEAK